MSRAPRIRSHWTSMRPIDPAPKTTAVSPERKWPRSSMCRATVDGSINAAASNGQVVRNEQEIARRKRHELGEGAVAA